MTSVKQLKANRRNAMASTGPKTMEGKNRSRRNSFKHGLTAETIVTFHEEAADVKSLVVSGANVVALINNRFSCQGD